MGLKGLTMLGRILDIRNERKGYLAPCVGKPSFELVSEKYRPIPEAIPEEQGISSLDIANFLEEIYGDETLNLHDIIIVRNGKKIAEAYFGAQKKGVWKATFSACKSITSIAIGMLIDEGKISLDTKLVDIFADEMTSVSRLKMRDITVYHLLTMTSGMTSFDEVGAICEGELFKTYVNTSLTIEPGKKFVYNSTNTFMLSAIVKKVSGMGLSDFLDRRLFEPLGIYNYYWEKSGEGIELGGWGLYISPEDFAKIGILLLDGGLLGNKQLISKDYVELATRAHVFDTGSAYGYDYGFQMWIGKNADQFIFNGMLGQNVWCFKKNGLVIVNNSGNDELLQQSSYFAIVDKYFNREFPDKIRNSRKNVNTLKRTLEKLSENPTMTALSQKERVRLYRAGLPDDCRALDGLTLTCMDARVPSMSLIPLVWQSLENNFSRGFDSIKFETENEKFYLTYNQTDETYRISVGFGASEYSEIYVHNAPYLVGGSGSFVYDEDGQKILKIRVDFLETPCSVILKFIYHNGYFELYQKELPGKPFVLEKVREIKDGIAQKPVIGGVTSLLEDDVLEYRVERLFEFKVRLDVM